MKYREKCTGGSATTRDPSRSGKDPVTLESLVKEYHNTFLAETNQPRTLSTRLRRLKKPLAEIKDLRPAQATPERIKASFLAWAAGKSPATAKSGLTELRAFWRWLRKKKHVEFNPWLDEDDDTLSDLPRRFKGPKAHTVKPTHDTDEAALLYEHLLACGKTNPRSKEAVALMGLAMGLRVGEVLGVKPSAIRRRKVTLHGKTGSYERKMPQDVYELVLAAMEGLGPDEQLWPYNNNQVYPWLRNLCDELGLQKLGMHALRRTNATLLAEADEDPELISKRLAHTDFRVTKRHYIKRGTLEDVNATKVVKLLESRSKREPST